jgi:hypothetical protein
MALFKDMVIVVYELLYTAPLRSAVCRKSLATIHLSLSVDATYP